MSLLVSSRAGQDDAPVIGASRARYAWAALGAALCVAALGIAGYELATHRGADPYAPLTAGQLWFDLHVGSLNVVQAVVQRYVHPGLWDPVITFLLRWPLWSLLGGAGVALVMLFPLRSG